MLTISTLHREARAMLRHARIDEADLDSRLLVEHLTGTTHIDAICEPDRPVSGDARAAVHDAVQRRIAGEPVHRILGQRAFHGLRLALSPETLEPRDDTEALVSLVLPAARAVVARCGICRILDLGTGTGAVALALLDELPGATALATDISPGALETARLNAHIHVVSDRFATRRSDWFDEVDGRFHIIVSNPPYIRSVDMASLQREVRDHDPLGALDGGCDGMAAYRPIAGGASRHLERDGVIAVEIGAAQAAAVRAIFADAGLKQIGMERDLGGRERALMFAARGAYAAHEK